MTHDLWLRRKLTLRAHDRQVVLIKRANEQSTHVLMKAFLWALYMPTYPEVQIEVPIGDRYKPDVVAMDTQAQQPRFWGEAGQVSTQKFRSLARRYRSTHFALARWNERLDSVVDLVSGAIAGLPRAAPFDVLIFPPDSAERFLDQQGHIRLSHADVDWQRLEAG